MGKLLHVTPQYIQWTVLTYLYQTLWKSLLVYKGLNVKLFLVDFDEDDMISSKDLKEVVDRLTGEQKLTDEDMQQLIDNVS